MRQVPLELIGTFSEGRKSVLAEQEKKGDAWNSGQLGRQAGAQLAGLVELQGQEKTSFRLELGWFLL